MMTCALKTSGIARARATKNGAGSSRAVRVAVRASKTNEVNDVAKAAAVMSLASPLLFTESASAAQEMMTVADVRAGILLFPLAAALGWVLFNIAGPTKNQIDDMNKKSGLVGAGLASLFVASQADAATEVMTVADGRAGILAFPVLAALGWVLFNIAGPTKNQIDSMSNK